MKPFPKTTLFLTTYNWPKALNLCLQSIAKQTIMPDEVIIADDGSGEDTRKMVEYHKSILPIPVIHVWQEDNGFRINTIRNKAIVKAAHPYIIQIDGDVILDPKFIEDHLRFSAPNRLLAGRRIRIAKEITDDFLQTEKYSGLKSTHNKIVAVLHHQLLYNSKSVRGVRGCNMSYWKSDAHKVNGYDESWTGKGPDDKEFAIRMVHLGVKIYNLKFCANQFHLHHGEEGLLDNYKLNQGLYNETIQGKVVKTPNGIK